MAVTEAIDSEIVEQRDRLLERLSVQRAHVSWLWSWYRGRQELPDVPAKYAQAYKLFLGHAITPWARLVVDAIAERLRVQGFYAGEDPDAAREAWRAFTRARLNADQRLVYVEALIGGTGYVSVGRPDDDGEPRITPESAFEVAHEPDLGDRQRVAAALKLYPLDYSSLTWVCELYRPDATYRWIAEIDRPPREEGGFPVDGRRRRVLNWEDVGQSANDTGMVPVVPFENRVGVLSGGASEIEDCVPVLQRIDRLTLDKMLTSYYGSFRQKWATGLQVPRDPDTGKPVEPYKAAVDRLWVNPAPDGRFGTMEASDVGQWLQAIDSEIATLAAISRVPAHYLMQRNLANPPSAESLIAGETGLVAKVEDRQASYGESWERAEWLRARMAGSPIEIDTLEVQWHDAEKRNPAQVADAATKLQAIGVPQSALWAYVGFTPQQVEEFTQEAAAAELLAAAAVQAQIAAATAPGPVPGQPGGAG